VAGVGALAGAPCTLVCDLPYVHSATWGSLHSTSCGLSLSPLRECEGEWARTGGEHAGGHDDASQAGPEQVPQGVGHWRGLAGAPARTVAGPCLSPSLTVSPNVSPTVSLSLSASHCVSHCVSLTVSLTVSPAPFLPLCLSLYLTVSFTAFLTVSPAPFLRLCLSLCLSYCVSHCAPLTVPAPPPRPPQLILLGCYNVTTLGLRPLRDLKQLATLDVSMCRGLDDGAASVLGLVPTLTSINLSGCNRLTDEALVSLKALKALSYLELADCHNVTVEGARALAKLSALTWLDLAGCTQVNANPN
jgi:hypothetical protein